MNYDLHDLKRGMQVRGMYFRNAFEGTIKFREALSPHRTGYHVELVPNSSINGLPRTSVYFVVDTREEQTETNFIKVTRS